MNNIESINPDFKKWALGFAGCDGGDIGALEAKSIWFCGLEYGLAGNYKQTLETLQTDFEVDTLATPFGYESWEENIAYIFNWQAMKLLAVIHDYPLEEYKKFAEDYQPFVQNQKGFFKMNLYPIAFKRTSHYLWQKTHKIATGFANKHDYIQWVHQNRFKVIQNWTATHAPKLIVCTGISYLNEFKNAFMLNDVELNEEFIADKKLAWFRSANNTLVVIIPFMVNRHGLNKNSTISLFGNRIKELLKFN